MRWYNLSKKWVANADIPSDPVPCMTYHAMYLHNAQVWNHHQHFLLVEYVRVTGVVDPSLNDEQFHRNVSWNNIVGCLPNCERIFDTFLSSIFVRLFGAPLFAKKCQHNTPRIMRKILNSYAAIQTRTTPGFEFVGGIKRSAGSKCVLQTWLTQLE